MINLAHKLIKLFKTIKIEDNAVLDDIYPIEELKKLVKIMDETGLFWLGDTLLQLITDNCDIIGEEVIRNKIKDSYVVVRLNENFVS